MLIFTAFLFLAGCGKEPEEHGLSEITAESGASDSEAAAGDRDETDSGPEENTAGGNDQPEADPEKKICVYVCGAVCTPDIYELTDGSRVYEAVQMAGGMTADAAADAVNLARVAADGEQIYIPTSEEVQTQGTVPGAQSAAGGQDKVNINTASAEELMTLSGIGEAKAESIIRYREENGGFETPEDLMKISGIKEGVFEKIKDDIII